MIIKEIQEQFNKVLSFSQEVKYPKTDKLFETWKEAKAHIIDRFGGLIYEVPEKVAFHLGSEERRTREEDFIVEIDRTYQNFNLANFLEANFDGFYENKTLHDYCAPDGTIIKAGTKIIKAFKYFEKDEATLAHLQNMASMIIQEDKIEGTLCFSVHPLDYLSSSENNYNWRSCHALDGDYRSGNLSYMCDSVTIICYLKGNKDERLPRFPEDVPWNSKKWRMLLTYDKESEIMFAGRQYPFFSDSALATITPYLLMALRIPTYYWSGWHDDAITTWQYKNGQDGIAGIRKSVPIGDRIYALTSIIKDAKVERCDALHFNDLLRSSCYSPYYSWSQMRWCSKTPKIQVGGTPYCICCERNFITSGEHMFCSECAEEDQEPEGSYFICECCGGAYDIDDCIETQDGSFVCPNCVELGRVLRCYECGDFIFKNEAIWDRNKETFVCAHCAERRENNG